eukprot:CAMPEP_0204329298 /NCGR_PEP_ID=MMETSP0469-20131031/14053_1 /ASSEMBLY_ACC=CAM_ASM_000384 /TAXON_ID=2969 /ORGANISM="Oxyrrhis marina" /LENGTH=61 /DNA_ID=CAMNT_0051311875 /DNA_START=9 /DNA_END=191 /DNA_ORIENTATION=+
MTTMPITMSMVALPRVWLSPAQARHRTSPGPTRSQAAPSADSVRARRWPRAVAEAPTKGKG